jgi:hypothetical protein
MATPTLLYHTLMGTTILHHMIIVVPHLQAATGTVLGRITHQVSLPTLCIGNTTGHLFVTACRQLHRCLIMDLIPHLITLRDLLNITNLARLPTLRRTFHIYRILLQDHTLIAVARIIAQLLRIQPLRIRQSRRRRCLHRTHQLPDLLPSSS